MDVLGALAVVSLLGCKEKPMTATMPVLFQAHGAPPLLDDPRWIEELAA